MILTAIGNSCVAPRSTRQISSWYASVAWWSETSQSVSWRKCRPAGVLQGGPLVTSGFKNRMSHAQMRPNNSFKPNPLRGSA